MKKALYILILLTITSCVPPGYGPGGYINQMGGQQGTYYPTSHDFSHQGGQYNSDAPLYSGGQCVRNPYIYQLDPRNWQLWEKNNYYVSCTTQGGYAYS